MANAKRTMTVGDQSWDIIGPEPETIYADGLTEIRVIDGITYISLCQHSVDERNKGQVRVAVRLRMPSQLAQAMALNIQTATEDATQRASEAKQKAN